METIKSYAIPTSSYICINNEKLDWGELIRDKKISSKKYKDETLQSYFNDLYQFFLYKLVNFVQGEKATEEDKSKLRSLFSELLRVKTLLENEKSEF